MNNQDFRKLFDRPSSGSPGTNSSSNASRTPASSLGSRMRSSIPMTPRTVKGGTGIDFQRQLAEQRGGSQPSTKKFRSSAAPKGSRLATGYTDRTQSRVDEDDDADDRAKRIKALEESMKLGQIDQDTFEKLRDQITGGDVSATHLVKGLDRQLLERVRRGEDVLGVGSGSKSGGNEPEPDVDDEFEQLEQREVAPVVREKTEKKGETALAGTKRTRNEILAELKAQRQAAAAAKAAAQPQLGSKFKRLGAHQTETYPRIEIDERGREVLITLDEDGHIKRKVRKIKAETELEEKASSLPMPDPNAKSLGMDVPEQPQEEEEEDDDEDIFEGVGAEYDPLAGLGDDDSSSEEEDGEVTAPTESKSPSDEPSTEISPVSEKSDSAAMPPPPKPAASGSIPKTNYFNDSSPASSTSAQPPSNPLTDPTILAAIRKAKEIDPERLKGDDDSSTAKDPAEEARLKKRAAMLAAQDRDLEDMDMGFGSSRFDDAEEMEEEGTKIKLSEWKGMGGDDDDGDGGKEKGGKKRKRGPKKRKGDKDSAADVLKTMERMKEAEK